MFGGHKAELLNPNPLVATVDGFLSDSECGDLIDLARDGLRRSVVTGRDQEHQVSDIRTSSECLLHPAKHASVMGVLMKIGMALRMPVTHAEGLNVLNYQPGEAFSDHLDGKLLDVPSEAEARFRHEGGQRLFSTMIYLNTVAEGGATVFPKLGAKVSPAPGRLLIFANTLAGAREASELSLHAGEQVVDGEKWACIAWWRETRYGPNWAD